MQDKITQIFKTISEHLADSLSSYGENSNQYYFGRLTSSEELYKKIEKILFKDNEE
jgi:hypothetical protein